MGKKSKPINERFFDEESKEMWFVLGLSYGRYFPSRQGTLNTWSSSSLDLIEIIKRELESDHKIIIEERTGTYKLRMRNGHLQSKLFEWGCIPSKRNRTFPEDIEEQYLDHFVRGFFDAHVSVTYNINNHQRIIQIGYNVPFLIELYKQLVKVGAVHDMELPKHSPLVYGSNHDVAGIHNFIYRDWDYIQEHGLYLPSKKERFKI